MGGLRSSAQMISYELAMGASVIGVVMLAGTLDLNGIIFAQIQSPFRWFIFRNLLVSVVFLIAAFAETNRVPFDLPEAETELVAGISHRILGAKIRALFHGRVREYVHGLGDVHCFVLGGWYVPVSTTIRAGFNTVRTSKSHRVSSEDLFLFGFLYWVRGTLPRFRLIS